MADEPPPQLEHIFITKVDEPPEGIRLAVKDILDTAGIRTTYGSLIYEDHVPDKSAEAVVRLERAGYADVGKANLHEFAFGMTSENPHYGTVPNPGRPGRIAGGSSGGSAPRSPPAWRTRRSGPTPPGRSAVPSAFCGTVGLRPTFGLVPVDGCFLLSPELDTVGPMARTVSECADMMAALAPEMDPVPTISPGGRGGGPRVGGRGRPAHPRPGRGGGGDLPGLPRHPPARAAPRAFRDVRRRETAETHAKLFSEYRDRYGHDVAAKLDRCMEVTDREYEAGLETRGRYRNRFAELMRGIDVVLTPTQPIVAPPVGIGDLELRGQLTKFTYPFSAIGAPALAVPCGEAEDGLPASIQVIGRPGMDALVLGVGALLESALEPRLGILPCPKATKANQEGA